MKLVIATNNLHKLVEIQDKLHGVCEVLNLSQIACTEEIPEDGDTFEANALQKAEYVYANYGYDCFADDSGLEIEALDGRPGVYSARYSGQDKDSEKNMDKVLMELQGVENRCAQFRTVVALVINGEKHLFEGVIKGTILTERHGEGGFGYDPIFQPDGYDCTFAEMSLEEKNKISHRGQAIDKLCQFLKNLN
ncbi:MAG: non-canonical purine NTP diphosphatase [Bacteroidales bacterium]|nr:non-canonical purine NTP diphosphatase [Bacteroidales bacterium]